MADTVAYVRSVEQLLIDTLHQLGLDEVGPLAGYPGVWVEPDGSRPRKIAAVGIRITRGRSMHGFSLNVDPDLSWFDRIVPCGITDKGVTSLAAEGIDVSMREVVDLENQGYQFEAAGASFDLLVKRCAGKFDPHFDRIKYHVGVAAESGREVVQRARNAAGVLTRTIRLDPEGYGFDLDLAFESHRTDPVDARFTKK